MAPLCVFVIGAESSGSKLVARILAHALDIEPYGAWNGSGWATAPHTSNRLCHRSQPYGAAGHYSDIERWNEEHRECDVRYVICTRDVTISERSRRQRWPDRSPGLLAEQTERARGIVRQVMRTCNHVIWSYETFMFLGVDYLRELYGYLGVESDFVPPDVADANAKHVRAG